MANPYEVNQQMFNGTLNGVSGKWVPVEENEAPANVSTDPNRPTLGVDGEYYYAQETAMYNQPAPIGANFNNAIPAPSSIVQLPPIVQPIAMVPYTTQNQPLVQYDPNYRPAVEKTAAPEPVYKRKAYAGISALVALFAIAVIVIGCLLTVYNDFTVITAIKDLLDTQAFNAILSGDMTGLFLVIVPVLYALICVLCVIVMLNALVKLGKMKPLGKLNGFTLAALILCIAALVIMMLVKKEEFEVGIGAYVIAGLLVVLMILPLFVSKKVQVLDYVASKQTYVVK